MAIREPQPKGEIVEELGARFEVFAMPADEENLLAILKDCFEEWEHIRIGPLIPGAIWEIRPPNKPRISMHGGYARVDFNEWHFHIRIGEHMGEHPGLAKQRKTERVELFRRMNRDGTPTSWGLRLLNGAGNQQISFMLPSPFLTDEHQELDQPDWSRLALWNRLRLEYLGISPDFKGPAAPEVHRG